VGTDVGPCKVCSAIQMAEDEYSSVIAHATEEYNRLVNAAFERKEMGVRQSGWDVETVSMPRRKVR
jgi:hypothetical protein